MNNEYPELFEMFSNFPAIKKLFSVYTDDIRMPLIIESEDWDILINPALQEYTTMVKRGTDLVLCSMILRYIFECSYVIGYNRGKNE